MGNVATPRISASSSCTSYADADGLREGGTQGGGRGSGERGEHSRAQHALYDCTIPSAVSRAARPSVGNRSAEKM